MTIPDLERVHMVVEGDVQGVGFRAFVQATALPLRLTGWVRNTNSGDVEVMAEGSRNDLEMLVLSVKRGPMHATVENVQVNWLPATGEFTDFRITFDRNW
jgi:acylphosphatase